MTISMSNNEHAQVDRHRVQARFNAEGALESATKKIQVAVANWRDLPEDDSAWVNGLEVPYTIAETGLDAVVTDSAGLQTVVRGIEEPMHKIMNIKSTPIFQFAVFYDEDLEILPGPDMILGGRVHTNADLYLGCGGTLTIDTNYVCAVGKILRQRKDDPVSTEGTVEIRRWVANPFDPFEPEEYVNLFSEIEMVDMGVLSGSGYDSSFTTGIDLNRDGDFDDEDEWLPWGPGALEFWSPPVGYGDGMGHTVMSDEHQVGEASVPDIRSISMYEETEGGDYEFDETLGIYVATAPGSGTHSPGYVHANADLKIITYADGTWDAFDAGGFSVKAALAGAVTVSELYDARQADGTATSTPVTTIDVSVLNTSGVFPANGLLYAAHYDTGTGTNAKGHVLKNGSELAAPLTFVSEGSLYVHGDYNTVGKKGAAVIGDAVSLLSNAWDGSKEAGVLPVASATSYNMAIVAGNHATSVGTYNGGLENLTRFHENWAGVNCNIVGSFVNTWESRYATGVWQHGGSFYKAPNRRWAYDEGFNSVENLPPFTPMAVSAEDVVTW